MAKFKGLDGIKAFLVIEVVWYLCTRCGLLAAISSFGMMKRRVTAPSEEITISGKLGIGKQPRSIFQEQLIVIF
jgi:hypothetical protein